jgi:hypothetical protein
MRTKYLPMPIHDRPADKVEPNFEYVKEVDANLNCVICYEILSDPVCCQEGHFYCRECIQRCLITKRECPVDRNYLTSQLLSRGRLIENVRLLLSII